MHNCVERNVTVHFKKYGPIVYRADTNKDVRYKPVYCVSSFEYKNSMYSNTINAMSIICSTFPSRLRSTGKLPGKHIAIWNWNLTAVSHAYCVKFHCLYWNLDELLLKSLHYYDCIVQNTQEILIYWYYICLQLYEIIFVIYVIRNMCFELYSGYMSIRHYMWAVIN